MLCGRPPFESRSHFELMMAHVLQAPAPPSVVQPNVPQFLDALVLKALAKDARDRYASAAAFGDAIAAANAEPVPTDAPVGGTDAFVCQPQTLSVFSPATEDVGGTDAFVCQPQTPSAFSPATEPAG